MAGGGLATLTPAAQQFIAAAICPSTQQAYAGMQARYRRWCLENGRPGTVERMAHVDVLDFLAYLGREGRIGERAIRSYRSALRAWWIEGHAARPESECPTEHSAVTRLMAGIGKTLAPLAAERRLLAPPALELTPQLIQDMKPLLLGAGGPEGSMQWAALNVAFFCCLRPSELMGSYANPGRALRSEQVTFYARANTDQVRPLRPTHYTKKMLVEDTPDRFLLRVLASKADQKAQNRPLKCATPTAVSALWEWMHVRQGLGPAPDDVLFQVPGSRPLSVNVLTRSIAAAAQTLSGAAEPPIVRGRCFRKGGAGALVAMGADAITIANAARWRTVSMIDTYASQRARDERALAISRGMGAPAAAATS